jgi:hypothetical protein
MNFRVVPVLLCTAIALATGPAAFAADDPERPPTELWNEFPLEPSATPSKATPDASPSPSKAPARQSDGMPAGAVVALLAAAAGVGGLGVFTATRTMRRHAGGVEAAAPVRRAKPISRPPRSSQDDALAAARDATRRGLEDARARRRAANGQSTETTAQPTEPSARDTTARPHAANGQAVKASEQHAVPAPAKSAPRRRATNAQPADSRERAGDSSNRKSSTPRKRDASGRFVKASEPAAEPKDTTSGPAEPQSASPEPPAAEPVRLPHKLEPLATMPDGAGMSPETHGSSPEPAAAPSAQPVWSRPAAEPNEWETCEIKLHSRSIRTHFFAVPYDGGPVIARSPYFRVGGSEGEPGLSAPQALSVLVDELAASGWRQTGAGRAPWDLRFERVQQAAAPRSRR